MNTEVIDAPTLSAVKVYNPIEQGIALLLDKHGHVLTAPPDVSTAKALARTKTNKQELVKFRTRIEAARKEEKKASLDYGRLVDSEAARITAIAAPIEKAYDDAIFAEETRQAVLEQKALEIEAARKRALQARVDDIRNTVVNVAGKPLADLEVVITELMALPVDTTFEEYQVAAAEAKAQALVKLDQMAASAREVERQRKELEAQRAEAARVAAITIKMADTRGLLTTAAMARSVARLLPLIERCKTIVIDDSYAEFQEQAAADHATTLAGLQTIYDQKVADGKRAAELERVQHEQQATQARLDQQARDQAAQRLRDEATASVSAPVAAVVTPAPSEAAEPVLTHPNGQPMFSTSTFKDNGEPIMLDANGKRSVFCDLNDDMDPPTSRPMSPSDGEVIAIAVQAVSNYFGMTPDDALSRLAEIQEWLPVTA